MRLVFLVSILLLIACSSVEVREEYFDNGILKSRIEFLAGVKHGYCIDYYKSGIVRSELVYIDGKLNGVCKWYHENGNVKIYANYEDSLCHGDLFKFSEDKKIIERRFFYRGVLLYSENKLKGEHLARGDVFINSDIIKQGEEYKVKIKVHDSLVPWVFDSLLYLYNRPQRFYGKPVHFPRHYLVVNDYEDGAVVLRFSNILDTGRYIYPLAIAAFRMDKQVIFKQTMFFGVYNDTVCDGFNHIHGMFWGEEIEMEQVPRTDKSAR